MIYGVVTKRLSALLYESKLRTLMAHRIHRRNLLLVEHGLRDSSSSRFQVAAEMSPLFFHFPPILGHEKS